MGLLAILQLINAGAPIVGNIILQIKRKNGSVTTVVILDEADSEYSADIADANTWLAGHGKATVPVTTAAPTGIDKPVIPIVPTT